MKQAIILGNIITMDEKKPSAKAALVKDGVVLRQKTDDSHPDSPDYPQQRAC